MASQQKVRVVVKGSPNKPYYPKGNMNDSDGFFRFLGCSTFFVAFIVIIVALNWPAL